MLLWQESQTCQRAPAACWESAEPVCPPGLFEWHSIRIGSGYCIAHGYECVEWMWGLDNSACFWGICLVSVSGMHSPHNLPTDTDDHQLFSHIHGLQRSSRGVFSQECPCFSWPWLYGKPSEKGTQFPKHTLFTLIPTYKCVVRFFLKAVTRIL